MLTLRQARQMVEAAIARAEELRVQQSIVIVDAAGNPITMDCMDGTRLLRNEFAQGKAFAAVFYRRSTAETVKMAETNPVLFHGALSMFQGKMFLVQGGLPIVLGGQVVGGIGVSGATGEQDEGVAQAGLRALEK